MAGVRGASPKQVPQLRIGLQVRCQSGKPEFFSVVNVPTVHRWRSGATTQHSLDGLIKQAKAPGRHVVFHMGSTRFRVLHSVISTKQQ